MSAIRHVIVHIVVHGRVQGVGYRAFVEHEAFKRNIEGWVRNRRDGSVEAVFSGDETVIADLVEACRRGPLGSRVDGLYEREGTGDDFRLRRSGETFSVLPTV